MLIMEKEIESVIRHLERLEEIDKDCKFCQENFYPQLREGKAFTSIFAPRHKASSRCRSGKNAHCTCDTCF